MKYNDSRNFNKNQVTKLYQRNGWMSYVKNIERTKEAIDKSLFVYSAFMVISLDSKAGAVLLIENVTLAFASLNSSLILIETLDGSTVAVHHSGHSTLRLISADGMSLLKRLNKINLIITPSKRSFANNSPMSNLYLTVISISFVSDMLTGLSICKDTSMLIFESAQITLSGIETVRMIKNYQLINPMITPFHSFCSLAS